MKNLKDFLLEHIEPGLPEPCVTFGMVGERCRPGAAHPAYAETYWHLINEEHLGLGRRGPVGYIDELNWIQRISEQGGRMQVQDNYSFCIFAPTGKLPIGMIGLHRTQEDGQSVWHTGTFIGKPWQKQGIGTEAKMFLLRWVSLNFSPREVPEFTRQCIPLTSDR